MSESVAETVSAELVNPTESRAVSAVRGLFDPDLDFRKLALEAQYYARGFRLVHKAILSAPVDDPTQTGIPFVVVAVTYRDGYVSTTSGEMGDYMSLEAVIADVDTLDLPQFRSVRSRMEDAGLFPNEPIVFNDGSTGIRRTMTELLQNTGLIDVGTLPKSMKDANPYDKPYGSWDKGGDLAKTGITRFTEAQPFRYVATRGLRRSDYDSEYGPATTFYFG